MRFWVGEDAKQFDALPADPTVGATPGLTITRESDLMASNANLAPEDGHYHLGKGRFRIRKGDQIPDGATFVPATAPKTTVEPTEVEPDERKKPAPANRAKKAAPENR